MRPERLRVAMLIWSYWPEPEGGAERQCRLMAQELMRRGHHCTIITSNYADLSEVDGMQSGATVRRLGWLCPLEKRMRQVLGKWIQRRSSRFGTRLLGGAAFWLLVPFVFVSRLSFLVALLRDIARRYPVPIDILHVHESGWLAGVGVELGRRWRIPVLVKEATSPALGPISYGTPGRRRWARLRREANGWAAQTPEARKQLIANGISPTRIHSVPNGVETPSDMAHPERVETVLYVGNLTQGANWKAFDVLFDAWIRVVHAEPSAHMIFVGAGDPSPWIRMLKEYQVAHTVQFAGRVPDPGPYYASAGIFILPSRVEGMSNALLEAQSWGLACIVSGIPGNLALVCDGINGITVPVGNASALADAICRLLKDANRRRVLGAHAREHVEREYRLEHVAEQLEVVYQTLREGWPR